MVHHSVSQFPHPIYAHVENIVCRTTTAGQPEGISKFVDESFDAAYNYTLEKGDLEHVRFGRIDYLDVTVITTKWALWSYVSASHRSSVSLNRFLAHPHLLY